MKQIILLGISLLCFSVFAETIECKNADLNINLNIVTSVTEFPNADISIEFSMGETQKIFELIGFYKTGYSFDDNKTYDGYDMPLNGDLLSREELISYSFPINEKVGRGYIDMKELGLKYAKLKCFKVN